MNGFPLKARGHAITDSNLQIPARINLPAFLDTLGILSLCVKATGALHGLV